jgi:hypothetical protein
MRSLLLLLLCRYCIYTGIGSGLGSEKQYLKTRKITFENKQKATTKLSLCF